MSEISDATSIGLGSSDCSHATKELGNEPINKHYGSWDFCEDGKANEDDSIYEITGEHDEISAKNSGDSSGGP